MNAKLEWWLTAHRGGEAIKAACRFGYSAPRTYDAEIATRSLRRAVAALAEHGPDGCALVLMGDLDQSTIRNAGLSAMPKTKPATAAEAA